MTATATPQASDRRRDCPGLARRRVRGRHRAADRGSPRAGRHQRGVANVDGLRAATVLVQLSDLAAEWPALRAGKARLLEASHGERSTEYVALVAQLQLHLLRR